jgi:hypothetical protein
MNSAPFADSVGYTDLLRQTRLTQLDTPPAPLKKEPDQDLQAPIGLIEESRYPRFVLVGRRGVGKMTYFHVICAANVGAVRVQTDATSWKTFAAPDSKRMHILDTRGVPDGQRPVGMDAAPRSQELVLLALQDVAPDAFLFEIKARKVHPAVESNRNVLVCCMDTGCNQYGCVSLVVRVIPQYTEPTLRFTPTTKQGGMCPPGGTPNSSIVYRLAPISGAGALFPNRARGVINRINTLGTWQTALRSLSLSNKEAEMSEA